MTVPAGAAPGGSCSPAIQVLAGQKTITETLPAGTTLTSVTTVPGNALVSSNLGAGTATVTVVAGGQTIATFLDTIIPVVPTTGFLQVCKVAGAGIVLGTPVDFDVAGTKVTVAAGPAPGGTCSTPLVLPAGPALITETVPAGSTLTSVSTLPAASLVSSNLPAGTATVTVTAGGQVIATFLNTLIPVIPTTGSLQICKVAGAGVSPGTSVAFNVAGTIVNVLAGPAPNGSCGTAITVPAGATLITETLAAGTTLASVNTLPASLLVSSDLSMGTATVTVNVGGQTIATFLNTIIPVIPTTGMIQVCKVAGGGVAVGTNFNFNVGGTSVTVPAGAAPGGTCSQPLTVPAGTTVVTETIPAGTALTSVSILPAGLLVSSNLSSGTASVMVNAGGQTIATFLNTAIPVIPATGLIQICKVAGGGVSVGTNFTFNVGGTMIAVPAGSAPNGTCGQAIVVQAGPIAITETLPAGTALTSVSTLPGGLLLNSNLAAGTATVTVAAGGQTVVTFLNTVIPVIATPGLIQVCKVAGGGVAVGTNFTFNVAGTMVTVPAGAAPGGSCIPAMVVPAGPVQITEVLPGGTVLTSVSTLPAGLLVSSNLPGGAATVTVNAGGQTIATFVNAIIPVISTTGYLQVCKVAGTGVPVGTNFTFSVAGTPVTVAAGTCSPSILLPAGQATIVEVPQIGITPTSITASPAGRLIGSSLPDGSATVAIVAGGTAVQSTLTFTNEAAIGLLKVCKLAGPGIMLGAQVNFTVGPKTISVPAGYCGVVGSYPIGTQLTATEMIPAGNQVTTITVMPPDRLLTAANLAAGTVGFTIGSGVTEVGFTNSQAVQMGQVRVCKIAGSGVTAGAMFNFTVAGANLAVPAGSCVLGANFPVGTSVTVTEAPATGTVLSAITVSPADRLGVLNLAARTVTATVGSGVTDVSFTNSAGPVELGLLKVCKIAGAGVVTGTNFSFSAGGTTLTVPAGYCVRQGMSPVGTVVSITELPSPGTAVSSISALPVDRQGLVDVPTRTLSVTIGVGVTEVYFTNVAIR